MKLAKSEPICRLHKKRCFGSGVAFYRFEVIIVIEDCAIDTFDFVRHAYLVAAVGKAVILRIKPCLLFDRCCLLGKKERSQGRRIG